MLVVALAAAATAGALFARQPFSMSQGFEKALSTSRSEFTFNTATVHNRVGDEGYWLTRAEMQSPALFAKPVAVGDRITISGTDGVERKLEVVTVKAVGLQAQPGEPTSPGLLLVTCRLGGEAPASETLVRFIVEGQMATQAKPEKSASLPKSL